MKAMPNNPKGFTLVELMVAMAAGLIVMIAIYVAYENHSRSHVTQQLVVEMQQNARAAMNLMKREIRMMGYDPAATDGVDNEDPDDGQIDAADIDESAGSGVLIAEENRIQFTADFSYSSATADVTLPDLLGTNENLLYTLAGNQLQRNGQIVAYDIEAVGFAYAFDIDTDDDESLDVSEGVLVPGANENIIWATDTNLGDNKLDTYLDTNDDGVIDENDTEGGAGMLGHVDIDRIRAVRIWLLARTRQPIKGYTDNRTYVVGPTHRGPADGDWDPRYKRVLLTTTIYCRNMGT
jgi:type IV pilus assembly protein PilW